MDKYLPLQIFGGLNLPTISPAEIKLRMHQPRGQKKYISKMRLCTRKYSILQRLRQQAEVYKIPPSTQAIGEYEDIDNLIMSARRKSNARVQRIHTSDVHSYWTIKISQLLLRLAYQIIKIRDSNNRIKLKTVTNLLDLTVRKWCLPLCTNSFTLQKATENQEYYQLSKKSSSIRSTYL